MNDQGCILRVGGSQANLPRRLNPAQTHANPHGGFSIGLWPIFSQVIRQWCENNLGIGGRQIVAGVSKCLGVSDTSCQSAAATEDVIQTVYKRAQWVVQVAGQGRGVLYVKTHAYNGMFQQVLSHSREDLHCIYAMARQMVCRSDT